MNKGTYSILALVLAGAAGCVGAPESEELQDLAPSQDEVPDPGPLAEADESNVRPCGDSTIAVITDARNNQYVFCALSNGRTGILESIWDRAASAPLTDRISDPVKLLQTVGGADLPPEIVYAVATGTPVSEPYIVGARQMDFPQSSALLSDCDFGTFQEEYCDTDFFSYWDLFATNYVDSLSGSYPDLDCTHKVAFCDDIPAGGTHQLTASAHWAYLESAYLSSPGGACAAKERVVSCGGSTTLNAWQAETVGGTWVSKLTDYVIPANGFAVWIMESNSTGSCHKSADRDDMRFRAESAAGATHNYSLIFIKWVDDKDDNIGCDAK